MKEVKCSICGETIKRNNDFEKSLGGDALRLLDKQIGMPDNFIEICENCYERTISNLKAKGQTHERKN